MRSAIPYKIPLVGDRILSDQTLPATVAMQMIAFLPTGNHSTPTTMWGEC
jgi:hypothetical protein